MWLLIAVVLFAGAPDPTKVPYRKHFQSDSECIAFRATDEFAEKARGLEAVIHTTGVSFTIEYVCEQANN